MKCYIREDSLVARLAARKLKAKSVAIVIGKTIYLHNARRQDLITNRRWLLHELAHVRQFQQHGFLPFLLKYLWESLRCGYYNNKYEVEARNAETNDGIAQGIEIVN